MGYLEARGKKGDLDQGVNANRWIQSSHISFVHLEEIEPKIQHIHTHTQFIAKGKDVYVCV